MNRPQRRGRPAGDGGGEGRPPRQDPPGGDRERRWVGQELEVDGCASKTYVQGDPYGHGMFFVDIKFAKKFGENI